MDPRVTPSVPKLVELNNFPVIKPKKRVYSRGFILNCSVLCGFFLVLLFFLYNCKYGMFRIPKNQPEGIVSV